MTRALLAMVVALALCSCASRPDIRYYQLDIDDSAMTRTDASSNVVFSVDAMIGDSAYEDPRIVYRKSPYRLDYYHYHRWTAPPGVMVSDFLREAYEETGYFGSVVAGFSPDASVFLSGRIIAFEEVDVEARDWKARIKIHLFLREARNGQVIWSRTIEQETPVDELNPEGVAAAMSTAVTQIVADTAPEFAKIAADAQDRAQRRKSRDAAIEGFSPGTEEGP